MIRVNIEKDGRPELLPMLVRSCTADNATLKEQNEIDS